MRDLVLESAESRVLEFGWSTFFDNDEAIKVSIRSRHVGLEGCNITRAFWTVGPGGVWAEYEFDTVGELFSESGTDLST